MDEMAAEGKRRAIKAGVLLFLAFWLLYVIMGAEMWIGLMRMESLFATEKIKSRGEPNSLCS